MVDCECLIVSAFTHSNCQLIEPRQNRSLSLSDQSTSVNTKFFQAFAVDSSLSACLQISEGGNRELFRVMCKLTKKTYVPKMCLLEN